MVMNLDQKKVAVSALRELGEGASSLAIADLSGVSVADITELRRAARAGGATLRVVKNRLALRAVEGTHFSCVTETLCGPSLFGFSYDDPGVCARLFRDFAKDHAPFHVRALVVDGQLLHGSQLDVLADLPTREQALARLLGLLQWPLARLHGTLRGSLQKLVYTLSALREQREQQQASPSDGAT